MDVSFQAVQCLHRVSARLFDLAA